MAAGLGGTNLQSQYLGGWVRIVSLRPDWFTGSPCSPNMCSSDYRYIGSCQLVDSMHMFTELWAMSFPVFIIISDK